VWRYRKRLAVATLAACLADLEGAGRTPDEPVRWHVRASMRAKYRYL
jgi:hypothetical protein